MGKAIYICKMYVRLLLKAASIGFSNNQLDKAVVLTDVPLEDVLTGTENTFKTSTVKLDALQSALGCDGGSTGPFQQKCNFT